MLLGLLSVTFGLCCCGGLPFSLAGAVCSIVALSQIRRDLGQHGRGMAIAGLVLSLVGLAAAVLYAMHFGFRPGRWRHIGRF